MLTFFKTFHSLFVRQLRCGSSGSEVSSSRCGELAKTCFDVISSKHAVWAAHLGLTITFSLAHGAVLNYYIFLRWTLNFTTSATVRGLLHAVASPKLAMVRH